MVKQQQKEEALFVVAIYNQILLIVQSDLVSSFFFGIGSISDKK